MTPYFKMTIGSHFFRLNHIQQIARPAVTAFSRRYIHHKQPIRRNNNNWKYQAPPAPNTDKVYAAATQDRQEVRYHIHQLGEFEKHLKLQGIEENHFVREYLPVPRARRVALKVKPKWQAFDYQIPAIAFIQADLPNMPNKLLQLGTGRGKSFCLAKAYAENGTLPMLIMRPGYFEKWIIDIEKTYEIDRSEIMTVNGSDELIKLLQMGTSVTDYKIILMSNKTLQNWITLYERFREGILDLGYPCLPDQMYKQLGVGFRGIDEVHLDFHMNFKFDLYTNVEKSASMSATLTGDDPYLNRMYVLAYPQESRHGDPSSVKHVNAVGLNFQVREPEKFINKVTARTGMYQHNEFEQLIMKNPQTQASYFEMICYMLEVYYFDPEFYRTQDKCAIYVYSIELATRLTEHLKKKYRDVDVQRYVEKDPYNNLMSGQIIVTNLLKAGTNVDIPHLSTVLLLHAVDSTQSNIQGFGRLRPLKNPVTNESDGRSARFIWSNCTDIPKHLKYHDRRMTLLRQRALTLKVVRYGPLI